MEMQRRESGDQIRDTLRRRRPLRLAHSPVFSCSTQLSALGQAEHECSGRCRRHHQDMGHRLTGHPLRGCDN
jgi:hypothetical protein